MSPQFPQGPGTPQQPGPGGQQPGGFGPPGPGSPGFGQPGPGAPGFGPPGPSAPGFGQPGPGAPGFGPPGPGAPGFGQPGPGMPPGGPLGPENGAPDQAGQDDEREEPVVVTAQPVQVDLLPKKYRQRLIMRKARNRGFMIMAVAAVVVVALFVLSLLQMAAVEASKSDAESKKAAAQAKVNSYAEVPKVLNEISSLQTSIQAAMQTEVLFSQVLTGAVNGLPGGTSLTSLQLTLTPANASAPATAAAGTTTTTYGEIIMTGTMPSLETGGFILQTMRTNDDLANAWLASATLASAEGSAQYNFSVSANLSEQALSDRYEASQQGATP